MASALQWIPDSLYNSAIASVVFHYTAFQKEIRNFHGSLIFDIFYKLYKEGRLCQLAHEFSSLEIFDKVLRVSDKRCLLHHCFQALMDHGSHTAQDLANTYSIHCVMNKNSSHGLKRKWLELGLRLGNFLSDAGWFVHSEKVIKSCLDLSKTCELDDSWTVRLDCYLILLHVQNSYSKFKEAHKTFLEAMAVLEVLKNEKGLPINTASLYGEFSTLFFCQSDYDQAYNWSVKALNELSLSRIKEFPPKSDVAVLRQAAKACVVKRKYKHGALLIKQALRLSRLYFGKRHPVMADTLIDYGFYLLNVDSNNHSIKAYQSALETRQYIFGGQNLLVAIAHEDLAYSLYVHEYSTGKFKDAQEHAEKAMEIMRNLLPDNHLLLASSKRVTALILEEIAIDNYDKEIERHYLMEAQELHLSALQSAREEFGELNVQTAKHYGNVGRLFQSMKRFEEAADMHLKAIEIKEKLLGPSDYEVALSVGHLASLYNYDMNLNEQAEILYLRSIEIGITLFGRSYSGLEYDYRGLLKVYTALGNIEKANQYRQVLMEWKYLREKAVEQEDKIAPLDIDIEPLDMASIYSAFLSEV